EETDFLNMDGDELDLVSGEKDALDVDLADDFNLDDLDHDLDELAGSFDGDFEDLESSSNDEGMEPLATVADEFSGDFSDLQEPETDEIEEIDEIDEIDGIEEIDEIDEIDGIEEIDEIGLTGDGYAESDVDAQVVPESPEF